MKYFIYGLYNPDSQIVYYIGKTVDLKDRLLDHLTPANLKRKTLKNNWIKSLLKQKKKPGIKLIIETDKDNVDKLEVKYIKEYRKINPKLKNGTDGGTGGDTSNSPIKCSNCQTYKTIKEAAKENKISMSAIIMVLNGELSVIHGLKFYRTKKKRILLGKKKYNRIKCSNGMVFDSCKTAGQYIQNNFKKDCNLKYIMSNIYACLAGTQGSIEGLQFLEQGSPQPKLPDPNKARRKPIGCSNGKKYESLTHASKELGIDFRLISQVLRKKQHTTRNLKFWFLNKKHIKFSDI